MLTVTKFVLCNIVIFSLSGNASANDISIDKTIHFIESKMNTITKHDWPEGKEYKTKQKFKSLGNCRFSIIQEFLGMKEINNRQDDAYGPSKETYTFDASTLNPRTIDDRYVNDGFFFISTTNNKKTITNYSHYYEPNEKYYCTQKYLREYGDVGAKLKRIDKNNCITEIPISSIKIKYIISPAHENTPRVKRAFEYLIKQCGGKDELF